MQTWYVYMVRCADRSLYTGVTTDLERRIKEHNGVLKRGAGYTRSRRPVELVYYEHLSNRSMANRREYLLRRLTKDDKEKLVKGFRTAVHMVD